MRVNSVRARPHESARMPNPSPEIATSDVGRAQPASLGLVAVVWLERCGWMRGYAGGWAGQPQAGKLGGSYCFRRLRLRVLCAALS